MSKKKKMPRKRLQDRALGSEAVGKEIKEQPDVYAVLQYLNGELQKSKQVIHAVKKEHCQLRDGFIFLISRMNELAPGIEKDLAGYYATNHNLSGYVELREYNIDRRIEN